MPLRPARLARVWLGRETGRIGLLGGSFNPAHEGHLHVSVAALKHLGLDEVWWLVSPQNPLKQTGGMAPLEDRLERARETARHPRIRVTAIERDFGTRYTIATLLALVRRFPRMRFVWLMGADNLTQVPRWADWTRIFDLVPVAVFARPSYSLRAMTGKAATRYRSDMIAAGSGDVLPTAAPPAWAFFPIRLHHASATEIRAEAAAGHGPTGGSKQYRPWT